MPPARPATKDRPKARAAVAEVAVPDEDELDELDQEVGAELEKADDPDLYVCDEGWEHQRIEYQGDSLAVRYASMQALTAYQLSSGKYISMDRQNDASGLFITNHLGPETYDRIMERMSDPEDPDYTMESFGQIMGKLVKLSIAHIRKQREALTAAKNGRAGKG